MEFVKRPITVEAVQWTGDNQTEVSALLREGSGVLSFSGDNVLCETREGTMMADLGDWIIRGIAGEIYPCKPEIFEATYEEVSPQSEGDAAEPATPADQPSA
jgi:hypothetical protein